MKRLTAVLCLHLAALCFGFAPHAYAQAVSRPLADITIAEYGEFPLYVALYVAHAKGYFEAEGLRVRIVPAGGDEKVFAALLSGEAQFGVGDPTFVAISGERGQPGRVIAAILQNVPQWGLTKNSAIPPIDNPAQLKGYRVATYPAPSTSYTLQRRLFQLGGLTPSIAQIAYGGLLAALDAGVVDIALEYEPMASVGERNGARRVYALVKYFPDFALTGLTVTAQYLESHPDSVQSMVNAFQRANNLIYTNLDDACEVVAKRFPELDGETVKTALRNTFAAGTFARNGVVREAGWKEAIRLRREVGDLGKDAPYAEYVVTKFAQQAAAAVQ